MGCGQHRFTCSQQCGAAAAEGNVLPLPRQMTCTGGDGDLWSRLLTAPQAGSGGWLGLEAAASAASTGAAGASSSRSSTGNGNGKRRRVLTSKNRNRDEIISNGTNSSYSSSGGTDDTGRSLSVAGIWSDSVSTNSGEAIAANLEQLRVNVLRLWDSIYPLIVTHSE